MQINLLIYNISPNDNLFIESVFKIRKLVPTIPDKCKINVKKILKNDGIHLLILSLPMTTLNTRNFLKWTSIAINIENPTYNKSDCMKLAIKELQKEKKMRKYIHIRSITMQKVNNMSKKESIIQAMIEWKHM